MCGNGTKLMYRPRKHSGRPRNIFTQLQSANVWQKFQRYIKEKITSLTHGARWLDNLYGKEWNLAPIQSVSSRARHSPLWPPLKLSSLCSVSYHNFGSTVLCFHNFSNIYVWNSHYCCTLSSISKTLPPRPSFTFPTLLNIQKLCWLFILFFLNS